MIQGPYPNLLPAERIETPDPVIFDARIKGAKTSNKTREPSVGVTQNIFNRIHQLTAPKPESTLSALSM